ncbi:MAG: hypothetical protein KGL39_37210 [Patescibacteria group bacterium]|nr:hypothetical protein [Patescibacteria group bacterium]
MSNITVTVGNPPRGAGQQAAAVIQAQAMHGSMAWGGSPSTHTLVYPGSAVGTGISAGAIVTIGIGGMTFHGLCKSDVGVNSARGYLRELQFVDLREFLAWDYVKCSFNNPVRKLVNGVWKKRYWHIHPDDFDTYTKTWTDTPLLAWQILSAIMNAPTVGSPWTWDLTGNGQFPGGLMNQPVFSLDYLQGVRLDAALNDLSERGGLVFTLDPRPFNSYRLVWTRKGYGLIPVLPPFGWPSNSDERRLGYALSGNATNINVLGERNRYTVLNLPLTPDWNRTWEQFLVPDALYLDLFMNEENAQGVPYNNYPNDPEHWIGANEAHARALTITVGEYVNLRNARASADGASFADFKKFSGRSRMDMPAALYISSLVFRAYRPNPAAGGITNVRGAVVPLDSVAIADAQSCRVNYDPASGSMTADTSQLVDGNGLVIIQGALFGQDLFQMVQPERVSSVFFSINTRPWTAVAFQIDDSGDGTRFIVLEQPAFTSENLLTSVGGFVVMNANPTLNPAAAVAALTFEVEPFSYWKGTWPNVSRDRVEFVSGLFAEYVGNGPGDYQEITFANGQTAAQQADMIAANLLICQYIYLAGGYRLVWDPHFPLANFSDTLTSLKDRIEIELHPNGVVAMVDFTTERDRDNFVPERDLDRRTLQNTLFPGQAELRAQSLDYKRFAAAIKATPRAVLNQFIEFLKGNFVPGTVIDTAYDPTGVVTIPTGDLVAVGTPVFKRPVDPTTMPPTHTLATYPPNIDPAKDNIFVGVTTTHNQNAGGKLYVQQDGEALCWVQGPLAANDPVGINANGYQNYSSTNSSLIVRCHLTKNASQPVGVVLQPITDNYVHLIKVNLTNSSGGGGDSTWLP